MFHFSFGHVLAIATLALIALITIDASPVRRLPYESPPSTTFHSKVDAIQDSNKAIFAYFTNWGIYGANFQPADIVDEYLSHILYAFADVDPSSGTVHLTDPYADEQKHFPGDSWDEPGNNLYGCLKQLYLQKLQKRNLKVLLSIGGWTYAQAGHFNFVTDPALRAAFATSVVQIIEDYGFDGVDIDYEYPANDDQGQGFADLLTEVRTALAALQSNKGDIVPYLLTAAIAAGPANYKWYNVPQMDDALDYWNLMSYDYAGSWLTWADDQDNLYGGSRTGVSTDASIKWFISQGATPSKINMGMPLYGRAFENTDGLGQTYSGIGPGTIEAGVYSYKVLPLPGASVFENTTDVSSYSYDSVKKELVSYDTPTIVTLKTQYIMAQGLAGSMFWDLSTDKVGADSLVGTASGLLGTLDQTLNHIDYPDSKWDNVKNNFGQGGGGTTTPPPTTTTPPVSTPPVTTPPTTTTPPAGGGCSGVVAWSSITAYAAGQQVTYASHLWTAKWWTYGDIPGGPAGAWTDGGAC